MSEVVRPALSASSLRREFADGAIALDDIDLTLERGKVLALVGANGSGKTTLLRLSAGVSKPSAGSIRVLGFDPWRATGADRTRLGYVSQTQQLDRQMTGAETLALFAALHGVATRDRNRLHDLARTFGLDEHWTRPVATYSGGLRQRLHLALSMVHEPDLLLLDEPAGALDPRGQRLLWSLVRMQADEGKTVIVVTHELATVASQCHFVALLHRGKLLACAPPAEVIATHARWSLRLQAPPGDSTAQLQHALTEVAPEHAASVVGRDVVVDVGNVPSEKAHAAQSQILDALQKRRMVPGALRLEPPDLAGAYFNLTGQGLGAALDAAASRADGRRIRAGRRRGNKS